MKLRLGMVGLFLFACDPSLQEEDCINGLDDNGNGAPDCQDEQCVGTPECTEICNNNQDDDRDKQVDCQDVDCSLAPNCVQGFVETCNDGQDNDGDTLVDCNDPSCVGDANCPNFIEICDNGQDEDLDNQVDCQDFDCVNANNCIQNPVEICNNGVNDDNDALIDCADPDCAQNPLCVAQLCDPNNDQCTNDEICIVNECEPAFGRTYTLSNIEVALGELDPNGECWDGFGICDDPDPFVEVLVNGQSRLTTVEQDGTFTASYIETVSFIINNTTSLEMRVIDADINTNDLALSCVANPVSADLLRGRDVVCSSADGVTVNLQFTLTPN